MGTMITKYNALCNLAGSMEEVFEKALNGTDDCFITEGKRRLGRVNFELPEIQDKDYNIRTNRLALAATLPLGVENYDKKELAVVCATTNSGVEEYETSGNLKHTEIGNTAEFLKKYYGLENYCTSVSTACSSGIKAFSIAREILESGIAKTVLVVGADNISKVPVYGFDSLEILSKEPSNPFGKGRCGINIGEGAAAFILEKDSDFGIEIAGIGETTDIYHATTPDPDAVEAIRAIRLALGEAKIKPEDVDYINLHGTGTVANDLMEGRAINTVFDSNTPASSTKPLTGHCLGAAASIEAALCCKLLESGGTRVFPHVFSGEFDPEIPKINLETTYVEKLETVLCTSFGFGGTNAALVLRRSL